MFYACPHCGVVFGRESGYFTGAMIFSYTLALPLLGLLFLLVWLVAGLGLGWRFEWLFLVTLLAVLPFGPALFRWSRIVLRPAGSRTFRVTFGEAVEAVEPKAARKL